MKLFSYYENNETHLGLCTKAGFVNVEATVKKNNSNLPTTLEALYTETKTPAELLKEYETLEPVLMDEAKIDYAPSVPKAPKILCVGLNYNSHIEETGLHSNSKFPPLFNKFQTSLLGHNHVVHLPEVAEQYDYEAELVIVMGKKAKKVTKEEALSYVYGYTVGNDFSSRDLQMSTGQWMLGKACDDFAPLGPFLVTKDEVDPDNLDIACSINGEVKQSSNTKHMIFSCAEIISFISNTMTLLPGDIIYTGTPEGVILGQPKEKQVWLKAGDKMEVTIEKLGTLTNTLE